MKSVIVSRSLFAFPICIEWRLLKRPRDGIANFQQLVQFAGRRGLQAENEEVAVAALVWMPR